MKLIPHIKRYNLQMLATVYINYFTYNAKRKAHRIHKITWITLAKLYTKTGTQYPTYQLHNNYFKNNKGFNQTQNYIKCEAIYKTNCKKCPIKYIEGSPKNLNKGSH